MSNSLLIDPKVNFIEQQKKAYQTCINSLNGLSVKDAEQILFQLMSDIKTFSAIAVLKRRVL